MTRYAFFASLLVFAVGLASPVSATQYEYDALNRVTKVIYDNGETISYFYDAAGNIKQVTSEGRCSTSLEGVLEEDDLRIRGDDDNEYTFEGTAGEPVTLRLETIPPEAGVGKFAEIRLKGEDDDDDFLDDDFRRDSESAIPTVITVVLPFSGEFTVTVKDADDDGDFYVGPYRLTLEASPDACASFQSVEDDDDLNLPSNPGGPRSPKAPPSTRQ